MTDLITGLRQAIQDLVAPDLKAIQVKQDATVRQIEVWHQTMTRQMEVQHNALIKTVEAFRAEMRSEFAALCANNQLEVLRQVSPFGERLSIVEEKRSR
jgi:DNA-binding FadR family transcriptional regulator